MVTLSPVDVIFSMQNAALFSTIISSITDFLELAKNKELDYKLPQLSEEEALKLQRLNSALQKTDDWVDDSEHSMKTEERVVSKSAKPIISESLTSTRMINLSATLPDAQITIVNDLQGLDQALFRVKSRNVVCGGLAKAKYYESSSLESSMIPLSDSHNGIGDSAIKVFTTCIHILENMISIGIVNVRREIGLSNG